MGIPILVRVIYIDTDPKIQWRNPEEMSKIGLYRAITKLDEDTNGSIIWSIYCMYCMYLWCVLCCCLKPLLHRATTFVPPLSDQKIDQDAQWSPKTRELYFCVTAASRTVCVPWTTKTAVVAQQVVQRRQSGGKTIGHGGSRVAVVAEWRHSGRHSDRSMDAIGRPKEAQWWYKGGRSIAQIGNNVYNCTNYVTGRPMADPYESILRPQQCACLPPASFEQPVSDRPPRRRLCDNFEHA